MEVQEIEEDEVSNAAAEKLNQTGHELFRVGYTKVTDAAIQLEWYVRDLVEKRKYEAVKSGSSVALGTWALRKLKTIDLSAVQDLEDLELQISGLSRLALDRARDA